MVSYSQMFQRPVQAAAPSMVDVLVVGQVIEKTTFLPSYETSGSDTSPLPCVMPAVTLNSRALADDFSRMIRSPPGALGVPSVGLSPTVFSALGVGQRHVAVDDDGVGGVVAAAAAARDDDCRGEAMMPTIPMVLFM